jgi:signal transduction histidine kinase
LVSLVDGTRQFFKAIAGLTGPVAEARGTPISHSFCRHVVDLKQPLVVPYAPDHPLVKDNPSIAELGVIAYLGAPIVDPSGQLLGSFCVIDTVPRDWTEANVALIVDLAAAVDSEIALHMRARELKAATEAAMSASRAKSSLLAVVSHEVRNPLNAVLGFADLLKDMELDSEALEYVGHINDSGKHLLGILDDLLDQARLESGAVTLELRPFDLKKFASDLISSLGPKASEKSTALAMKWTEGTPANVKGDSHRLRQILLNILGNATKFTSSGSISLSISHQLPSSFTFLIKDTGIGIPKEQLEHVFNRFAQADATTHRKYGGTGLGLAISRELAEMMGGGISVESVEGEGSEFKVVVKLEVVE